MSFTDDAKSKHVFLLMSLLSIDLHDHPIQMTFVVTAYSKPTLQSNDLSCELDQSYHHV